jgi:hypothetical protein
MTPTEIAAVLGRHAEAAHRELRADVVVTLAFVGGKVAIGAHCPDVETLALLLERALRDIRGSGLRVIDKRRFVP